MGDNDTLNTAGEPAGGRRADRHWVARMTTDPRSIILGGEWADAARIFLAHCCDPAKEVKIVPPHA